MAVDGPKGTPKIGDVARRAGVSTATVSRALSQPTSVAPETRRRVMEAVRDLAYTPNAAARNLRAGKTRMVLVVVAKLANPFFAEILRGINAELHHHGYGLIIGDLDNGAESDPYLVDLALAGQLDGIIMMSQRMPAAAGRSLTESGLPMVGLCVPVSEFDLPSVTIDDKAAAALQVRHLVDRGHRRLIYLAGNAGNFNDTARYAGVTETAAALGIGPVERVEGDYTFAAGSAAGLAVLSLRPADRPTGVIAASDEMAIGFIKTVSRHHLRVPADISVIGFDGMEFANYSEPTLTTISQPRRAMGIAAARMILKRIGDPEAPIRSEVLPVALQLGASTAPPRSR